MFLSKKSKPNAVKGDPDKPQSVQAYRPISDIEVAVGIDVILQIIFIALALAAVSSVIGIIRITQYEPLKILRERN